MDEKDLLIEKLQEEIELLKKQISKPSAFDFYFDNGNKRKRGIEAEIQLKNIITGETTFITIEAKSEVYKWQETGNIYIEVEQLKKNSTEFEDSGLDITEADYWAHKIQYSGNTDDFFIIIAPVPFFKRRLKEMNEQGYAPLKRKGRTVDGTATTGYAANLQHLFI